MPIIQAPFRFFYAYNYARLTETIQGPCVDEVGVTPCSQGGGVPGVFLSKAQQAALPYGVLQTQIVPQLNTFLQTTNERLPAGLIEPKSTFRFTVSRTF